MAVVINEGWLWLSDGTNTFKLLFKECRAKWVWKPTISHYVGATTSDKSGSHFFYDLGEWFWSFEIIDLYFTSHSDYASFVDYISDWQLTDGFTIQVQRTSGGDFITFDGTNTSYTVACKKGLEGIQKVAMYNDTHYKLNKLLLEQIS